MPITDRQDDETQQQQQQQDFQKQENQNDIAALIQCTSGDPAADCFDQSDQFTQAIDPFNGTDNNPFDACAVGPPGDVKGCYLQLCPAALDSTIECFCNVLSLGC